MARRIKVQNHAWFDLFRFNHSGIIQAEVQSITIFVYFEFHGNLLKRRSKKIVHENRGLNPHIEDVARRAAVAGFLALAPDGLFPAGGYPGNDDDGRTLQRSIDRIKLRQDMLNSAHLVRSHALSTGRLGVTGFCWGGGVSNYLATEMGDELQAAVPFYGAAADTDKVAGIRAALMIQSAENDPRVNAMWPDYETALKKHGVRYLRHVYPDTRHGFHNNSTPRFNESAAALAWTRTVEFFEEHLR